MFVGGEVGKPAALKYAEGMTALQAIQGVGGFNDQSSLENAILIRRMSDRYEGYRLFLKQALSGEDYTQDVALKPNDVVFIPKSRVANVNMVVKQYIANNIPTIPVALAASDETIMSVSSQEQAVLTVVPSPAGVADKESFLRSPELAFCLDKQRVTYDYTFLDAPPILRHADGTLASLFCDGVVLVARAGVPRGEVLARARQQVERVGESARCGVEPGSGIRFRSFSGAIWLQCGNSERS